MNEALFDDPPHSRVRRTDPLQSVSAARLASERLPSRSSRILDALSVRNMTDDEICHALGEHPRWWPSVKSARSLLKSKHKVFATDEERKGQTVWSLQRPVQTSDVL